MNITHRRLTSPNVREANRGDCASGKRSFPILTWVAAIPSLRYTARMMQFVRIGIVLTVIAVPAAALRAQDVVLREYVAAAPPIPLDAPPPIQAVPTSTDFFAPPPAPEPAPNSQTPPDDLGFASFLGGVSSVPKT